MPPNFYATVLETSIFHLHSVNFFTAWGDSIVWNIVCHITLLSKAGNSEEALSKFSVLVYETKNR